MYRLRSISLPRFGQQPQHDNDKRSSTTSDVTTPYNFSSPSSPLHLRNSSATSFTPSLVAPIHSTRGHHQRWSSSSSSLATSPDSPVNIVKPALHDLVEDPAERDDFVHILNDDYNDHAMCICDTVCCEHQSMRFPHRASTSVVRGSEWSPGDDTMGDTWGWTSEPSLKRRRSGDVGMEGLTARLTRRFPSLSRQRRDPTFERVGHADSVCSVSPSRAPSLVLASPRRIFSSPSERGSSTSLSQFPLIESSSESCFTAPSSTHPMEIDLPQQTADPIDRKGLTSTPLLPPMMSSRHDRSADQVDMLSPLQSPTVVEPTFHSKSSSAPALTGYPTPPLSAKPSTGSFNPPRHYGLLTDASTSFADEQVDVWAMKLGHANFHIYPEPYLPAVSTAESCKRLREDWETARTEYLRQTIRISEHYGPTSPTYKLTGEKWASIDAQWREHYERAVAEAESKGDAPVFQPLATHQQALSKIPSLNDPANPTKFLRVDDAEIVGPMVQYAKPVSRPSKKRTLLRIFTDPASLLVGRTGAISASKW